MYNNKYKTLTTIYVDEFVKESPGEGNSILIYKTINNNIECKYLNPKSEN